MFRPMCGRSAGARCGIAFESVAPSCDWELEPEQGQGQGQGQDNTLVHDALAPGVSAGITGVHSVGGARQCVASSSSDDDSLYASSDGDAAGGSGGQGKRLRARGSKAAATTASWRLAQAAYWRGSSGTVTSMLADKGEDADAAAAVAAAAVAEEEEEEEEEGLSSLLSRAQQHRQKGKS